MINISTTQVEKALSDVKMADGIKAYLFLIDRLHKTNVSTDKEFQKKFNHFWRMRQRSQEYYQAFFAYMELHKGDSEQNYKNAIHDIYKSTNRVEGIFCSKMIALADTSKPVLDTIVMEHFKLLKPIYNVNRFINITKWIEVYNEIAEKYKVFLSTEQAQDWLFRFDTHYKHVEITSIKKIDFILWQIRER